MRRPSGRMRKLAFWLSIRRHAIFLLAVLTLGIFVRAIGLGSAPAGLNQDEAFAGYEAYSLLHYGVDSAGYGFPCYFVSWGSGMNVLESYLAIPFIWLFGLSPAVFRLPQLILSCLSLLVFYLLLRELFPSRRAADIGLCLLTVSPWHILLSRWGLESNLAPAFLLFGFYFFVKGIRKNAYWILAAVMYGLALYAYAITWLVVPLTLAAFGIYVLLAGPPVRVRYVIVSVSVLFLLALPLILFLLVNQGLIPEISTPFFSVPKLAEMRAGEISLANLLKPQTYGTFLRIFLGIGDGLLSNTPGNFGMFYPLSIPFLMIGLAGMAGQALRKLRARQFSWEAMVFLGFFCSAVSCLLIQNLNINKANSLHIYTLIFITAGLLQTVVWCRDKAALRRGIALAFALSFLSFSSYYFGDYQSEISASFNAGVGEAVDYIEKKGYQDVCVDSSVYHSQILFFSKTPAPLYHETVVYHNYPSAFLTVKEFYGYHFGIDYSDLELYDTYLAPSDNLWCFPREEYQIKTFGRYLVAHRAAPVPE